MTFCAKCAIIDKLFIVVPLKGVFLFREITQNLIIQPRTLRANNFLSAPQDFAPIFDVLKINSTKMKLVLLL